MDITLGAGTYYVRIDYPINNLLRAVIYTAEFYYDGVLQKIDTDVAVYKELRVGKNSYYRFAKFLTVTKNGGTKNSC